MLKSVFEDIIGDEKNVTDTKFYQKFAENEMTKEEAAEVIKNEIIPAYKDIQRYIFEDYYKYTRSGPGLLSFSNLRGQEYYQACLKDFTGQSDVDADELHMFGLESLKKSQAQ